LKLVGNKIFYLKIIHTCGMFAIAGTLETLPSLSDRTGSSLPGNHHKSTRGRW